MEDLEINRVATTQGLEYHQGVSKVDRHGWKLSGRQAEFAWIDKNDLKVDTKYQRAERHSRVMAMARDWDWVACGAIIVSLRSDGDWFVIDGQHRVAAAKRRVDIRMVPCLIFELEGIQDEAAGFLSANIGRRPMSYVERFNALLQAGDQTAAKIAKMITGAGRKVGLASSPTTISCLSVFMRTMAADEAAFRRIWPVILDVYAGEAIHADDVAGFFWLETSLPGGQSLGDKGWRDRCVKIGPDPLRRAMVQTVALRGAGGPRSAGLGILAALNKGLRNPLTLREGRSEAEFLRR